RSHPDYDGKSRCRRDSQRNRPRWIFFPRPPWCPLSPVTECAKAVHGRRVHLTAATLNRHSARRVLSPAVLPLFHRQQNESLGPAALPLFLTQQRFHNRDEVL